MHINTNKKITILNKLAISFFSLIIFFIFLEIILRLCGFIYIFKQNSNINIANKPEGTKVILCLGESTTGGLKNTWPDQLETILNQNNSDKKFIVINGGLGGTNTAFILSRVKKNIKKYNPDIVVSMMGSNDYNLKFKYNDNLKTKIKMQLIDIKSYKLAKWLYLKWKNIFKEEDGKQLENDDNVAMKGREFFNNGQPDKALEILLPAIEKNSKNQQVYVLAAQSYHVLKEYTKSEELFKKSLQLKTDKDAPLMGIENLYSDLNYSGNRIENFYQRLGYPFEFSSDSPLENSEYHYRNLYDILIQNNIKYFAMQFPTVDVNIIKKIFNEEEQKNITFISNENNFNEALSKGSYSDYFVDNPFTLGPFKGNYGHATIAGNKLIAENVAQNILNNY